MSIREIQLSVLETWEINTRPELTEQLSQAPDRKSVAQLEIES